MLIVGTIVGAIVIICLFIYRLEIVKIQGIRGERRVARILGRNIEDEQYVINDLLFVNEIGKSCQIDHIFINKYGIWVIETKNYAGYIYGDDNQQNWMQVLAYGKKKSKFYNPVKQNKTHIYYLAKVLNINNIFQNVVVFLNRANLKNVSSNYIYSINHLKRIKTMITNVYLSNEDMKRYYDILIELKNNTVLTNKEHVKIIHETQNDLQRGICPRCGGNLVIKNGKYGQFYGCSNFPKCRFIKKN